MKISSNWLRRTSDSKLVIRHFFFDIDVLLFGSILPLQGKSETLRLFLFGPNSGGCKQGVVVLTHLNAVGDITLTFALNTKQKVDTK